MSIIRSPRKQQNFTIISNEVCLDHRLSMRGLGLLVRLLSRPDNWKTTSEALAKEFNCGRDQMRSTLQELSEAGYMVLQKDQDEQGRWSSHWLVFDEPTTVLENTPEPEKPTPENPYFGKTGPNNKNLKTRTNIYVQTEKPNDVSEAVWQEFSSARKLKKAPITPLVLKNLQEQADLAGWPLEDVLQECVVRGWHSFKADWVKNKQSPSGFDPAYEKLRLL